MKKVIRWQVLALLGLGLLALGLRLYGLNWDQGNSFHPDERQIMFHVMALAWPGSLAQFFDPANSPLNPRFFAYGSFPLYLLALLGHVLGHFFPAVNSFTNLTLVGRVLSALFDSGTVLLTGWLALLLAPGDIAEERNYAWSMALLAAALVAWTPLQVQLSHFYAVDTMLLFFVILTVLACVALVHTSAPIRWSLVAGLGYGLALATKFSAAPLAVPLLVALVLRWSKGERSSTITALLFSSITTIVVFLIAMPYALLDRQNFVAQLLDQGSLARGGLDLPYVRQFYGTIPYVYEAQNMLLWGLGVTLGLAAFAGLLWVLWRVWKRTAGVWLVVLAWVLVYGAITGSFYVKFMRYMLPLYPFLALMAAAILIAFWRYTARRRQTARSRLPLAFLRYGTIVIVLAGTLFQGLALLNIYSQPNTRVQASRWMYSHLPPGSVLTYEQWDDPLPIAVDGHDPGIFQQATYPDASGQPQAGLDLYGDDTVEKAHMLATLLPGIDAITMPTDRLDKSIPRIPARYPLTIHYYQLLFSGQLGFHLAAQFENHPNLLGITLDDSGADESYSVFDHPHARIFVRDTPYPYTPDQLFHKLLDGVHLPVPGAQLSGTQRSLLLTPQQIADDQQSPPFSVQFPANSLANAAPVLFWWLALLLLGLLVYPLIFPILRTLADRGYIFSKTLGILLLAYPAWLLAATHMQPFSRASLLLVMGVMAFLATLLCILQRRTLQAFLLQRWRLLLFEELLFTLAFLLFVGIRALNPDLWHIYLGGEKPMELAFLNAVLRSPYMPPYDPWFADGYINYYYYGYVIIGALIKLTGIFPMTAFNLALPTLFALTFTGAVSLVYSLTARIPIALLGGYFAALLGNFDGLAQFRGQLAALLAHMAPPAFQYWQSSRVIPFTINEFPFWSFLFADLHPHVIDMPIAVLMLGLATALLLSACDSSLTPGERRRMFPGLYVLLAFVFGTIACVNPWDMPVYAVVLAAIFVMQKVQEMRGSSRRETAIALAFHLVTLGLVCGLGYLCYAPFYAAYQQLYVDGLGLVQLGTRLGDYLTLFGLWIFLALSFFLLELYRWWTGRQSRRSSARWAAIYLLVCGVVLILAALSGLKTLLVALVGLGGFLFIMRYKVSPKGLLAGAPSAGASLSLTYLLLLMGLCISLGMEIVYVRDFLDGGDYERMNTIFKFSMQAWLCFAIGGALAVHRMRDLWQGLARRVWLGVLVVLVLSCSVFLPEGSASRLLDHQAWIQAQPPSQSAAYLPTLDGFAFAHAWYPSDASAIEWLNAHVAGAPVILEAEAPVSYQWFNRVSVYTGLPDVLGWPDHEDEQRYSSQPLNRITDIGIIYTTTSQAQAFTLLRYYHVRYIYVGALERQIYAGQSTQGLDKFDLMLGDTLKIVYRADGVTIYEVL
ncbi:MAG: DUF2298 domain-containing protein [Ktedonobacteraceae bacterium]